jgi:hypothetical protein
MLTSYQLLVRAGLFSLSESGGSMAPAYQYRRCGLTIMGMNWVFSPPAAVRRLAEVPPCCGAQ